jgi:hypothetical protein
VSATPVNARQGRFTIGIGVALIVSGAALQALNVQSFASQAPPGFASNSNVTLLATVASLLFLSGVIVTIIGTIRYAQSGRDGAGYFSPTTERHTIGTESRTDESAVDTPVSTPRFCSSCGARIVGAGHYCASCGTPTAR